MSDQIIYVTCPKGVEYLLEEELKALGLSIVKVTPFGVYVGDFQSRSEAINAAYKVCLWSRIANRVMWILLEAPCDTADQLYSAVHSVAWEQEFDIEKSFSVRFTGTNRQIKNTLFAAQKVKDAVVDRFRDKLGDRPNVSGKNPDIFISGHLNRGKLTLALDLSGSSLHQRGYRENAGKAPLKENLAAAVIRRADLARFWEKELNLQEKSVQEIKSICIADPLCGSGTLLIEAAMMALNLAPGLLRKHFGFTHWKGHDPAVWHALIEHAKTDRIPAETLRGRIRFSGSDIDAQVVSTAKDNAEKAGVAELVTFSVLQAENWTVAPDTEVLCMITNPPYGERLGEVKALENLYRAIGENLHGQDVAEKWWYLFTSNPDLSRQTRWRADKTYKFMNGALPCVLYCFSLRDENYLDPSKARALRGQNWKVSHPERAAMLVNRLKKNQKLLKKWLVSEGIQCYRWYDADMPEYSVAIDLYQDWYHVQEYVAPASVSVESARERFFEVLSVLRDEFSVNPQKIIYKRRSRQSGATQYQKISDESAVFDVNEYGVRLEVNLTDYLDTGLFLDHRPIRHWIQQNAKGKSFLNLFCYTGAVTAHAVKGGASRTVSVDMSNTYIEWAKRNLQKNTAEVRQHEFIRDDCFAWLKACKERFDLIFLDPPTFSNSKKMSGILDIQRDHSGLIDQCVSLLNPGGVLIFSNNLRKFKLDEGLRSRYQVVDITKRSIDRDFLRNTRIHNCWDIRRA
ncbi:SAM-dependent fused 23S rRNA m(2)G2445 and m(7)G2069 methyltransferase [Oleiphilus messinensis]|uniref:Ribosomal RNA large subunit methyltransferase K/L n=1 Tax=Oleiphilus messinensis TaxID=141451 RepID=A0A1Y0ICJ1_9GAMM|nr:bifunctional 23S rRNA (guanine(2069)-N(7))-methyltransferase RlmK/23S rRNA (guanine(2445)-N(2))-methyltransferase RlmL [Oleiphilus messinensis]ARU57496.1 SAM-dependent fused 23S rRNA m(2)G2445 and m(7)G2069 methyltransferase [Oleiphilus messinensis]